MTLSRLQPETPQTRTRPEGVRIFALARPCRVCGSTTMVYDGDRNVTFSGDGDEWEIQPHQEWCPVLVGVVADGCPTCGAAVENYEYRPGYQLAVPNTFGASDHLVGTMDEIYESPDSRRTGLLSSPTPNAAFSEMTVEPCGHVLEGSDAQAALNVRARVRAEARRVEADRKLAEDADLLAAAVARGQRGLAEAYRQAVYAGSREVAGLRSALTVVTA